MPGYGSASPQNRADAIMCKIRHSADQPDGQPEDQPEDQPADQPADQPIDQPAEQPADQPADQPGDQPDDQPEEQPPTNNFPSPPSRVAYSLFGLLIFVRRCTGHPADQPADQPDEQPAAGRLTNLPAPEQPKDQFTDHPTDQPADQPAEQPTAQPDDQPAEPMRKHLCSSGGEPGEVQILQVEFCEATLLHLLG